MCDSSSPPRSLALQVQRELAGLRRQLRQELRRALAAEAAPSGGTSRDGSGSSGTRSGGWLGRLFGGSSSGSSGSTSSSSGGSSVAAERSVASIRAGRHPALAAAAAELGALVRRYNSAVLADKEALGAHWPLDTMRPQLDWTAEADTALAELTGGGGSTEGGSNGSSTRRAG